MGLRVFVSAMSGPADLGVRAIFFFLPKRAPKFFFPGVFFFFFWEKKKKGRIGMRFAERSVN